MFRSLAYLQSGNEIQRLAYRSIRELNILQDLAKYTPVLCGTIPIAIDVAGSDLDIIMEVHDFGPFREEITRLYGGMDGFAVGELPVRGIPSITSNFCFGGFEFELFAQPVAVEKQNAYRHMVIEHHLLNKHPQARQQIMELKEAGMKTEPAFARVFGLKGDPYDALLVLGAELGIIQ